MKQLPHLYLLLILCIYSCGGSSQSVSNEPLAQYRDTLIGNFNGLWIDTLMRINPQPIQ